MTNYIKVRPYVAQRLGVEDARYRYADGNVLIWDKELRMIDPGWVFHPAETVARIGGLMMDPYRNREEQGKTAEECTPLPEPTDPAWADTESEGRSVESVEFEAADIAEDENPEVVDIGEAMERLAEEAESVLSATVEVPDEILSEIQEGGDA